MAPFAANFTDQDTTLLAGTERWLDRKTLRWGCRGCLLLQPREARSTDGRDCGPAGVLRVWRGGTVRVRAGRCRLHVPRGLPGARRVRFGQVGRDLKASSARGRFPASPAGHHPDSQAVAELYIWGCYLKKTPRFLSDDPSPVSISQWQLGLFHQRSNQWQAHTYWKEIFGTLLRGSPLRFSKPQAPHLLSGHNSDSGELWRQ